MAKRRPAGDGLVRQRDDGRWEGRIVVGHKENGDPIFHYMSAKTQKALLEKLHKSIDEYDGAELTEQSRMTLGEWLDIWLVECADSTSYYHQRLPRIRGKEYQALPWEQTDLQGYHRRNSEPVPQAPERRCCQWRPVGRNHGAQDTQRTTPGTGCGGESAPHRKESFQRCDLTQEGYHC